MGKRNDFPSKFIWWDEKKTYECESSIHEPKLLHFDEPIMEVDIELRQSMWNFHETK